MASTVVKTLDSGVTFKVSTSFQDSDGVPNLYISYSAEDANGKEIKGKEWPREVIVEHGKVSGALERAGFRPAQEETVMMDGPGGIHTSEGLEHPRYKTARSIEGAAAQVLRGAGYEEPQQSVVIPPQAKKPFADRVPEPQKKQVDLKKMNTEIEDKIAAAMGNTPAAMKLTAAVMDIVKEHMRGAGMGGPGGAGG